MKRNQSIDSMRYLAAFAVVTLHVGYAGLPAAWGENIRLLSRWAVPFFFIISGYFLHAPGKPLSTRASSQIVRLAWLLLFWSLVYTLVNMGEYGIEYGLSMLLRSEVFVYGTYSHLWFLGSAMLGGLALAVIDHYRLGWVQFPLAIGLLALVLAADSYNFFHLTLDVDFTRQLLSIPCMIAGGWLRQWKPSALFSGALIAVGVGLQFIEADGLYELRGYPVYDHQFLFGTALLSFGLAALALNRPRFLEISWLAKQGQAYSLGIYLLHRLVVVVFSWIAEAAGWIWIHAGWWSVVFPLLVLAVTTLALAGIRVGWFGLYRGMTGDGYKEGQSRATAFRYSDVTGD